MLNIKQIAMLIVETLVDCPDGGPSGSVYMALNSVGVSLDEYQQILGVLKSNGLITESGHWLKATPKLLDAVKAKRKAESNG